MLAVYNGRPGGIKRNNATSGDIGGSLVLSKRVLGHVVQSKGCCVGRQTNYANIYVAALCWFSVQ